jgi:uncharacterized protein YfcZ (UPF0381/DUF406 family)
VGEASMRSKRPNSGDGHSVYRQTKRRQYSNRAKAEKALLRRINKAQQNRVEFPCISGEFTVREQGILLPLFNPICPNGERAR